MKRILIFIQVNFWSLFVVVLSFIHFIPKTIECLMSDIGASRGYVAIELLFDYFIHLFFIFNCILLVQASLRNYLLIILMLLSFLSFIFAFRSMELIVFIPLILYTFIWYFLAKKIKESIRIKDLGFRNFKIISFFISLVWLLLDNKYL